MSNLTQNHIKWISDFTKDQFDQVVYVYIEEVFGIKEYVSTDGTNDGGNDIRVFANGEKLKVGFQVTIQETKLEKKINDDLKKTKENIDAYGYQKALYFFYSKPVSEEKVNEYELLAQTGYDIKLYLIDAKKIAFTASKFSKLLRIINKLYGIELTEMRAFSETDRMLYDFYSFGTSATEIKNQLIKSYIVHKLYELGAILKDTLFAVFGAHFNSSDKTLFNKVIGQLINERRIKSTNNNITLSAIEAKRIDVLKEQFHYQENDFRLKLLKVLNDNGASENHLDNLISNLKLLFESNFKTDKLDVLDQIGEIEQDPVSEAISVFYRYVKSITHDKDVKQVTKDLIEVCQTNDVIQKLSAGKMFSSFINPDVITNYLNQTERIVFFDTPVILYTLCFYCYDVNYPNYYYTSVKDLFKLNEVNKSLKYNVYRDYLGEVGFHLREALLLVDFDKLGYIPDLGGSNNVFYNFYLFLQENELLEEYCNSFEDFLYDCFEINYSDLNIRFFQEKVQSKIKECLASFNIEVYEMAIPKEIFNLSVECITQSLEEREKHRSKDSIANDAYMMSTLFNDQTSVNEPILLTWDLTFLPARKKYHQKIPASRLWHWFTPDRLYNHFSLLTFNLNSQTVTRDILTVIDEKFDFYKRTQSLLDTVSRVLNLKTETGRKYVNAIKEFKRDYIYGINEKGSSEFVDEEKKLLPIQEFMLSLVKFYSSNKQGVNLDDLRLVFQTESIFEEVVNYFKEELAFYVQNKRQSEDSISKMNELIKTSKELKLASIDTETK